MITLALIGIGVFLMYRFGLDIIEICLIIVLADGLLKFFGG
jgi:hypothetical protein